MTDRRPLNVLYGDRAALLVHQPFLALLAMQLELTLDGAVPTVGTDGRALRFNPSFVEQLGAPERRFYLAHLVWHCALLHPWRRGGRDRAAWDLACDHEVNAILESDFAVPSWATIFEDHAEEGADAIYDWLSTLDRLPGRSARADEHEHPRYLLESDRALERRWAEHVVTAAQQLALRGQPLPSVVRRLVEHLRTPRLDWAVLLRRFVDPVLGDRRHWLPPNRRHLHRGTYLPSRRDHHLRVAVGLDTSASTAPLQTDLLGELCGILDAAPRYELTLMQADHELCSVETFSRDHPLDPNHLEPVGGGGTDLGLFFAAIETRALDPSVVVILTDGLGPAPSRPPPYPVIWALPSGCPPPVGWGSVLHFGRAPHRSSAAPWGVTRGEPA